MEHVRCDWNSVKIPVTRPTYEHIRTRKIRIMSFLDKSEAAIIGVKIVVGTQLAIDPPPLYLNPVSHILRTLFPGVPLWVHGMILVVLAMLHVWAVVRSSFRWRRLCIAAGVALFLYIGWAAIMSGGIVPGLLLVVLYTLFGVVNYMTLMRPPAE